MANLLVDDRDLEFVLYEQLKIDEFCEHELFQEHSKEIFDMVLNEARKLAINEIMPTNIPGDREGCVIKDKDVKVPESYHKAWKLFVEGGWIAISESPEVGGQGMPSIMGIACNEYFIAANMAFIMFPGLTHGSAGLIDEYGTPEQKQKYMERMFSGEWSGTMCLTEPQAGTDVGAIKTTAKKNPDGTYSITGSKIFISAGSHDLTDNIIHPVLAHIEGAPEGTKGISIFIVPKYRVNDDGSLGEFNDVNVGTIEHKMGIHGSPTCVLNFGEDGNCIGELLGEENKGMRVMFQMMNEARIGVGLQALGVGSTSYLHGLKYAKERIQGPDIKNFGNASAPKVPIIQHPDVRRMLMFMKSVTEGLRSLLYFTIYCVDKVKVSTDEKEQEKWQGFLELLTPIVKSYGSDMAFRVSEVAMQVHGGYGYTMEYPIDQFMRDLKITSIYEGANGIQALDLIGRKLGMKKGKVFMGLIKEVSSLIEQESGNEVLSVPLASLKESLDAVSEVAMFFGTKGLEDFEVPVLYAAQFLELMGDMVVGWQLIWQAAIAQKKLDALFSEKGANTPEEQQALINDNRNAAYYSGKIYGAKFFANMTLTLSHGKAQVIKNASKSALEISEASFASS